MHFDDIHLIRAEKQSLFSFHFKKVQQRDQIRCFDSLYHTYHFIKENHLNARRDELSQDVGDGTYSLSEEYERYRVYLREKRFYSLPNWVAILVSLLGVVINLLLVWLQYHIAGIL